MNDEVVIQGEVSAYKSLKDGTVRVSIDLISELETVKFHEAFRTGSLVAIARLLEDVKP